MSLPVCGFFVFFLKVKSNTGISPQCSTICKVKKSLSLLIRWNSDGAMEFWETSMSVWRMFFTLQGNMRCLMGGEVRIVPSVWCLHYSFSTLQVGAYIFAEWRNGFLHGSLTSCQKWRLQFLSLARLRHPNSSCMLRFSLSFTVSHPLSSAAFVRRYSGVSILVLMAWHPDVPPVFTWMDALCLCEGGGIFLCAQHWE